MFAGIRTLNWYSPLIAWGAAPAYRMSFVVNAVEPIVMVYGMVSGDRPEVTWRACQAGLVGPKPVPYNETISPGAADRPPATTLGSATGTAVPPIWAAMLFVVPKVKK